MDRLKRLVMVHVPMSICNFRCHYCYLSHRPIAYQGEQLTCQYSPDHVGKALSKERLGGTCFFNFCAEGETLLARQIDEYIYALVKQGHYVEIVTNMTVTPVLEKILAWEENLLRRVEFKCSFHYLELKQKELLNTFANNVNKAWEAGASASIEITPSDELIPLIEECRLFSMKHFGAMPQLTIARNDATKGIEYLTNLAADEYRQIWGQFDSPFWRFKTSIFKERRREYCYAGQNAIFVDLATGIARQCYRSFFSQDVFANLDKPINFIPIGKCREPHCYNGHALLTMGCIPNKFADVRYGSDIRDRVRGDGTHWLNEELRGFFDQRTDENNLTASTVDKLRYFMMNAWALTHRVARRLS
jgi:hypothetical protein